MSNNGNKDWFYWIVNNIASLPDLGIDETDLNKCIKGAKVGLVKAPENNTDYTKAGFHNDTLTQHSDSLVLL